MAKLRTIVSLWGRSKIGKTSTLKQLAKFLETIGKRIHLKGNYNGKKGDFEAVFVLGKDKLAIISKGDPPAELRKKELLILIEEHKPNFLFCASRTSGETVTVVQQIAKQFNSSLIWTSPYESDRKLKDYDQLNNLKSEHLVDIINKLN